MTVNRPYISPDLDLGLDLDGGPDLDGALDDAPDLSTPDWAARFAKVRVQRGRPRAAITKVSTTIRLDAEVLERFRAAGAGWQGRINAALRKAAGLS